MVTVPCEVYKIISVEVIAAHTLPRIGLPEKFVDRASVEGHETLRVSDVANSLAWGIAVFVTLGDVDNARTVHTSYRMGVSRRRLYRDPISHGFLMYVTSSDDL